MTAVQMLDRPGAAIATRIARVAVATDGMPETDHALFTAAGIARAAGATLSVVSVCELIAGMSEPWPIVAPPIELFEDPHAVRARRVQRIQDQLKRLFGTPDAYHVTVRFGAIAREIAGFAQETGADLLVTGRGRHRLLARVLGEEHLTRVLRTTLCPVLAVEPATREVPRTVVVGLDLSERDAEVLAATAALIPPDAGVHIVHVKPDAFIELPPAGNWTTDRDKNLRNVLVQTLSKSPLAERKNTTIELLSGHPGIELTGYARRVDADLVAVGIHGAGFVHRMVIGSATTYLLRTAEASLLAVPPKDEHSPPAIM